MAEDQSRASAANCICDNRADCWKDLGFIAFVASKMDAVQLFVDVRDEHGLSSCTGLRKAPREESAGSREAVQFEGRSAR